MNWHPSPNFSDREGHSISAIVIHVMEGTFEGTRSWFGSKKSKVSAHYGLSFEGEIDQYVQEENAAWHAGLVVAPTSPLVTDYRKGINPNLYTIGIEHEGTRHSPWPSAMYEASVRLSADICRRRHITPDRVHIIGHREIRADKSCPGDWLDLNRYVADVASLVLEELSLEQRVERIEKILGIGK